MSGDWTLDYIQIRARKLADDLVELARPREEIREDSQYLLGLLAGYALAAHEPAGAAWAWRQAMPNIDYDAFVHEVATYRPEAASQGVGDPEVGCPERHGHGSNRDWRTACIVTGPHTTHQTQYGEYWS